MQSPDHWPRHSRAPAGGTSNRQTKTMTEQTERRREWRRRRQTGRWKRGRGVKLPAPGRDIPRGHGAFPADGLADPGGTSTAPRLRPRRTLHAPAATPATAAAGPTTTPHRGAATRPRRWSGARRPVTAQDCRRSPTRLPSSPPRSTTRSGSWPLSPSPAVRSRSCSRSPPASSSVSSSWHSGLRS